MSERLTIDGLTVVRGLRPVVRDVSLEVPCGEVTALLGPNGAGKSTLVQAIAGLLPVSAGAVRVGDVAVTGRPPHAVRAAGVAVVPEGHRVLGDLTVLDNLAVAGHRLSSSDLPGHVERVLGLLPELRDKRDHLAGSLSGGQQQMLAIAQALVWPPKHLVIDELSLGLAPVVVSRLVPVLRDIADAGVGVLLIEQFTHVALGLATTAYVMEGGRIRHHATAGQLREHPELLHAAYLGPSQEAVAGA